MKSLISVLEELLEEQKENASASFEENLTDNSEEFLINESLGRTVQPKLLSRYNILRELTLKPSKIRKSFR